MPYAKETAYFRKPFRRHRLGGWQIAALHNNVKPIWSSEIERFPLALTKVRFPETIQLGDVTKIDGAKIPPVDIICSGSPCQSLSVAGKREGLQGESGLFFYTTDIIRRMREATGGKYPRFLVWENVPGALNSSGGNDFRAVLEAIAETEIPMPPNNKWAYAGLVQCDRCEIAWRCMDAQYWGVPQRRNRVWLVADFAESDRRAKEILFVEPSSRGDSTQSEGTQKGVAGSVADGVGDAITLRERAGKPGGGKGPLLAINKSGPLMANTNDQVLFEQKNTVYDMTHAQDVIRQCSTAPTLQARMGTGGNQVPIVLNDQGGSVMNVERNTPTVVYGICSKDSNSMKSGNPHSGIYETEVSRTLDTGGANPNCNQGGNVVVYALEGNGSRPSHRGDGWAETEKMYTLNTVEQHAVAQPINTDTKKQTWATGKGSFLTNFTEDVSPTLMATDWKEPPVVITEDQDETDNNG